MRNNSLAMLATVAAVGILAWGIGFFDPETCVESIQQPGWTSCETIARERQIALWVLIAAVALGLLAGLVGYLKRRKQKPQY
jgi:hypothetical protein